MMIVKQVMRAASLELRGTMAIPPHSGEAGCSLPVGGITPAFGEAQFRLLDVLVSAGGSLPVSDIADRCHVAVPTISKMLNHLEANGMIERQVDRSNRRIVHVVLTDAGRAAKARMEEWFRAALQRVFSPLTDNQLSDVIVAFDHLAGLVDDAALAR
jgi:DNA-binding MarR family transcriptional regulator